MKILFVTATRIGDAVLSSGILARLMELYPRARFTVACGPAVSNLFDATPRVETVIPVIKRRFSGHWFDLWLKCLPHRWDMVVDLRGSALGYALWVKQRYVKHGSNPKLHKVEDYARVLGFTPPPAPTIWLGPDDQACADRILERSGRAIAIGPAANWNAKIWPSDRFAELVRMLTRPDGAASDADVVVMGSESEREVATLVLDSVPPQRRVDLMGASLRTTAACLKRCALYVGNDSGLMHIAAAVGTPTLGLFGPTSEALYAPWGDNTSFVKVRMSFPPNFDHRTSPSLMTPLSAKTVHAEAVRLLQRTAISQSEIEQTS